MELRTFNIEQAVRELLADSAARKLNMEFRCDSLTPQVLGCDGEMHLKIVKFYGVKSDNDEDGIKRIASIFNRLDAKYNLVCLLSSPSKIELGVDDINFYVYYAAYELDVPYDYWLECNE